MTVTKKIVAVDPDVPGNVPEFVSDGKIGFLLEF